MMTTVCWQISGEMYILNCASSICTFLQYNRHKSFRYIVIYDPKTANIPLLHAVLNVIQELFEVHIERLPFEYRHEEQKIGFIRWPDVMLSRLFFPMLFPNAYVLQVDSDVMSFGEFPDDYYDNYIWMQESEVERPGDGVAGFMLIPPNMWDEATAEQMIQMACKGRFFEQTAINQQFEGKIRLFPKELVYFDKRKIKPVFYHLVDIKQWDKRSKYYELHKEWLHKIHESLHR